MSEKIVQLNDEVIKGQSKELVCGSVEETLNELLEKEAESLTQAARYLSLIHIWDSCMYSDFTKMSAGQPRPTQLERFRQRFMHKLVYFPDNNDGCFGCVGCGRCLAKCPIHMNIVKVIKTLGEEHA